MSKRILALVLVVAMLITMAPFAGANNAVNDMNDVDAIDARYLTAAGVLVGMGVFEGTPAGNFEPQRIITRAEMTAVMFRLLNGPTAAPAGGGTTFTDVVPGSGTYWARDYIGWAEGEGLVVGVGGGRFEPGRGVTSIEASIMMLRALGYGARNEFQGSGWAQRAINFALSAGLLRDVAGYENVADPARREVIAQIAFNGLDSVRVQWNASAEMYVPDPLGRTIGGDVFGYVRADNTVFVTVGVGDPFPGADLVNLPNGNTLDFDFGDDDMEVTTAEVGRQVRYFFSDGTGTAVTDVTLFYVEVVSSEVVVPFNATATVTRNAVRGIGSTVAGLGTTANRFATFENYEFTNNDAFIPATGNDWSTGAAGVNNGTIPITNLNAQRIITYVVYRGDVISAIWADRGTVNLTINAANIAAETVQLGTVTMDIEQIITTEIPLDEVISTWVDVERVGGNGALGVIDADSEWALTRVETFTGALTLYADDSPRQLIQVEGRAGNLTWNPEPAPNANDLNHANASARLRAHSDIVEFGDADLGVDFTYYVSGFNGHIVAAVSPDAAGATPPIRPVYVIRTGSWAPAGGGMVIPHATTISAFSGEVQDIPLTAAAGNAIYAILVTGGPLNWNDDARVMWVSRDPSSGLYSIITPPASNTAWDLQADLDDDVFTNNTAAPQANLVNAFGTNSRFVYISYATEQDQEAGRTNFTTAHGPHAGQINDGIGVVETTRELVAGTPHTTLFVFAPQSDPDAVRGNVYFLRGLNAGTVNEPGTIAGGFRMQQFDTDTGASLGTVDIVGGPNPGAIGWVGQGFYRINEARTRITPIDNSTGEDRRFAWDYAGGAGIGFPINFISAEHTVMGFVGADPAAATVSGAAVIPGFGTARAINNVNGLVDIPGGTLIAPAATSGAVVMFVMDNADTRNVNVIFVIEGLTSTAPAPAPDFTLGGVTGGPFVAGVAGTANNAVTLVGGLASGTLSATVTADGGTGITTVVATDTNVAVTIPATATAGTATITVSSTDLTVADQTFTVTVVAPSATVGTQSAVISAGAAPQAPAATFTVATNLPVGTVLTIANVSGANTAVTVSAVDASGDAVITVNTTAGLAAGNQTFDLEWGTVVLATAIVINIVA